MKYTLKTNDTLKCSACGNKEFKEKHLQKENHEKWVYVCEDCGNMMTFAEQLKPKS